jgi:hypothetical protein
MSRQRPPVQHAPVPGNPPRGRPVSRGILSPLGAFATPLRQPLVCPTKAFSRHHGIYRSDVACRSVKPGGGYRLPLVGPEPQSQSATGGTTTLCCSSSTMSPGRLFLDRVARQHCPSPLHRHGQITTAFQNSWLKHDISTLPAIRHFYFALTGNSSALYRVNES